MPKDQLLLEEAVPSGTYTGNGDRITTFRCQRPPSPKECDFRLVAPSDGRPPYLIHTDNLPVHSCQECHRPRI